MAQSSSESKFTLRLVVDEAMKKVVFAEACRDFVDVLFSFLTLPMGTIVRLLEEHRKSETVTVGCFSNLYKSVVDMGVDDFETEACKQMLLYPRSVRDVRSKRLKLNINPNEGDKLFTCPTSSRCKMCCNFSTSLCLCGQLMNNEIPLLGENVEEKKQNDANGVFVKGRSSFIITDDLQVAARSTDFVLKNLKFLGCGDISKVGEMLVDVRFEEVMTLLECIFSSNSPLTDTFLSKKQKPQGLMMTCETLGPLMERRREEAEGGLIITLSAIMRKQDKKVLYVECGQDFVDLLFTFLAIPLESVLEISGNISSFGCIGNLFGSYKNLSATQVSTSKCVLPHYYSCKNQLLNITTEKPLGLYTIVTEELVVLIDPRSHGNNQSTEGSGFVKGGKKFTATDNLIITPMNSTSAFCLLKKLQIRAEDLEVQEISITKTEATNLLRASLMTSSALNTSLWNLILKKPKEET